MCAMRSPSATFCRCGHSFCARFFGHGVLRQYGGRLSVSGVDDGAALQFVAPVIWVRQGVGVGFVFVFNAGFRPVVSNGDVFRCVTADVVTRTGIRAALGFSMLITGFFRKRDNFCVWVLRLTTLKGARIPPNGVQGLMWFFTYP